MDTPPATDVYMVLKEVKAVLRKKRRKEQRRDREKKEVAACSWTVAEHCSSLCFVDNLLSFFFRT